MSTSLTVSVPPVARLPAPLTATSSVTEPVAAPPITAASFEPVTVTSMSCVAVPSLLVTLSVSCTVWPATSACVAALLLFSA